MLLPLFCLALPMTHLPPELTDARAQGATEARATESSMVTITKRKMKTKGGVGYLLREEWASVC